MSETQKASHLKFSCGTIQREKISQARTRLAFVLVPHGHNTVYLRATEENWSPYELL